MEYPFTNFIMGRHEHKGVLRQGKNPVFLWKLSCCTSFYSSFGGESRVNKTTFSPVLVLISVCKLIVF